MLSETHNDAYYRYKNEPDWAALVHFIEHIFISAQFSYGDVRQAFTYACLRHAMYHSCPMMILPNKSYQDWINSTDGEPK